MTTYSAPRRTIVKSIEIEGLGLHGGAPVKIKVHPGSDGLAFRAGTSRWLANAENVTDTERSTRLGEINTIEHLMAALAAHEVTDAEIEVEGGEIPGLDGSAKPFYDALAQAAFADLDSQEYFPPFKRVYYQEQDLSLAAAGGTGHWRYDYLLTDRWPGQQSFEAKDVVEGFGTQIAPARTFALAEEIPMILQAGLGRGLDKDSVLIVGIEGYKNEARFEDECARHKLLDLCGDLYLSGLPLRCLNVVAVKSGHRTNVKLAQLLREASERQSDSGS